MEREFLKGNEAIAEAAVRAGCRFFAGYPITPQNEIPEYLSKRLYEVGGEFVQGESEVASSYMIYGASMTGTRVMSSSSGCGIALYSEGIGYLTGAHLPAVIINVARGGPGLGSILPAQQDYLSATKAPANGGARCFVLAPSSVQEAVDMTYEAFDIADKYRCIAYILADGVVGNMMEGVVLPEMRPLTSLPNKDDWIITKRNKDGSMRMITSCLVPIELVEVENIKNAKMYEHWKETEVRVEEYKVNDAEIVLVAYGISARISKAVIDDLRVEGVKAGLIRPITLFPFPEKSFSALSKKQVKHILCLEMSLPGQMIEDVKAFSDKDIPVSHFGRSGGVIMKYEEVYSEVKRIIGKGSK